MRCFCCERFVGTIECSGCGNGDFARKRLGRAGFVRARDSWCRVFHCLRTGHHQAGLRNRSSPAYISPSVVPKMTVSCCLGRKKVGSNVREMCCLPCRLTRAAIAVALFLVKLFLTDKPALHTRSPPISLEPFCVFTCCSLAMHHIGLSV